MYKQVLIDRVKAVETYFNRSTGVLTEDDSQFVPAEGMYTVASQVYHVGDMINWFVDGAFGEGWGMDFDKHVADAQACTSLAQARELLASAIQRAVDVIGSKSEEELTITMDDDDPIMPGAPRGEVVSGMEEHTAHHRGALTVYARLLGKVAPMPYM